MTRGPKKTVKVEVKTKITAEQKGRVWVREKKGLGGGKGN